jgi:membrane protein CcdC involved in cytochrome C biogenesis
MWDQLQHLLEKLPPLAWNFLLAGTAILSGLIINWVLSLILLFQSRHQAEFTLFHAFIRRLSRPVRIFIPLLVLNLVLPTMQLNGRNHLLLNKLNGILLILSFAFVLTAIVKVCEDYVVNTYYLKKENNLMELKIRTQ